MSSGVTSSNGLAGAGTSPNGPMRAPEATPMSNPSGNGGAPSFGGQTALTTEGERKKDIHDLLADAPRDLGHGVMKGVKSIFMGVGAGAAGLVAMPTLGAQKEGVPGFFKGLGAGLLGAVVLPVAGAVTGVSEVVGGLANTPQAIRAAVDGKEWDRVQKKWVRYDLNEEATRVLAQEWEDEEQERQRVAGNAGRRRQQAQGSPNGSVKDTAFYDLLGVPPTATAEEVKKAYYKTARRVHPDKNPDDKEAHAKFQQLSTAYQVLSNDQLRAAYDRDGADSSSLESASFVDPALFFNMLFGSDKFEPYVGRLKLAAFASVAAGEADAGEEIDLAGQWGGEKALRVQNAREVKCAMHLVTLLDVSVKGDSAGFQTWCEKEAAELAKAAFGPTMLIAVGWAYENAAQELLGYYNSFLGVDALVARTSRTTQTLWKRTEMAGATLGALRAANDLSNTMQPKPGTGPTARAEGGSGGPGSSPSEDDVSPEDIARAQTALNDKLPVFVDAIWKVSALDIQETVTHVCNKVLRDKSVDLDERKRRAAALLLLGRIFRKAGEAGLAKEKVDARREVETALHKTLAAANGQEL